MHPAGGGDRDSRKKLREDRHPAQRVVDVVRRGKALVSLGRKSPSAVQVYVQSGLTVEHNQAVRPGLLKVPGHVLRAGELEP